MEQQTAESGVYFSIRDLADLLGVTVSGLSHAVRAGHRVKGVYPVADWAVRGEAGRVVGFDVPDEAADVIAPHRTPVEPSTRLPLSPHPAPVEPALTYAARPDADYERQGRHFQDLLDRARAEADALRADVRRMGDALEAEREARRKAVDELRERLAAERDRHAEERAALRDEASTLRAQLRAHEAGVPPEEDEGEDGEWTVEGMIRQYGGPVIGALAEYLTQGKGGENPPAAPAGPQPPQALPTAPSAPVQDGRAVQVDGFMNAIYEGLQTGNVEGVADGVRGLQGLPFEVDWKGIARHVAGSMMAADPSATQAPGFVRPLVEALYPAALAMPADALAEMAKGYFDGDALGEWAGRVVRAGLSPKRAARKAASSDPDKKGGRLVARRDEDPAA